MAVITTKEETNSLRKRLYSLIELDENGNPNDMYDYIMMISIVLSLVPLAFKEDYLLFECIDHICALLFIVDYIFRWITFDIKSKRNNWKAFVIYPFTPMAIVDLISILPSLTIINNAFKILRLFRMSRILRVFKTMRILKGLRYSKSVSIIIDVLKYSRDPLIAVGTLASGYILISALIIFNVEPQTFPSFFNAIYWATVSLTTVGYGDIYPVSTIGRIIAMLSSILGIAIVALPAGIITAGYMKAITNEDKIDNDTK